ncbi:hypothetical protein HMPREF0185_02111 [Brevundimonas diminuta 470-4]|nr:hypothetical protein HMPREF0185_02111 [Brevundimonas diminuta 470-4]
MTHEKLLIQTPARKKQSLIRLNSLKSAGRKLAGRCVRRGRISFSPCGRRWSRERPDEGCGRDVTKKGRRRRG